jgi:hypothetical protein
VAQAYSLVDHAEALLVAGSSLTVFSGYRFVRHAAARGIPVAIVNRGRTRGDDLASVKVDGGCSELLVLLASQLEGALEGALGGALAGVGSSPPCDRERLMDKALQPGLLGACTSS